MGLMDATREKAIQALAQVNRERRARKGVPLARLVDEAAMRFDLDAGTSEWLLRMAVQGRSDSGPTDCPTCGGALQPAASLEGMLVCGSGHLIAARQA